MEKTIWEFFERNKSRGKLFGRAMRFMSKVKGFEPHFLLDGHPWETIGGGAGTTVDFGGSFGTAAISIVNRFPHLECVIQDKPPIVPEGKSKLPVELSSSVIFMAQEASLTCRRIESPELIIPAISSRSSSSLLIYTTFVLYFMIGQRNFVSGFSEISFRLCSQARES